MNLVRSNVAASHSLSKAWGFSAWSSPTISTDFFFDFLGNASSDVLVELHATHGHGAHGFADAFVYDLRVLP